MIRDFRQKAREMSAESIADRLVELAAAVRREPGQAHAYRQQAQLLRDELDRRGTAIKQLEAKHGNAGPRQWHNHDEAR